MDISYILNELGEERDHYFNAIAPPIVQTSNFKFNTVDDFRAALADEYQGNLYTRGFNPTVDILRKKLAALDDAEDALVFGSGVAAVSIPVLALLKQGDEVICVENPYSWTIKLFNDLLPKFGIKTTFVEGSDTTAIEAAITPQTKLIYLESPNTFSFEVQDLATIAQIAKANNIITMIDNSYCSPLYQQPIAYGIDLVAQSATKYLAGHSDVVAGVVTGKKQLIKKIFEKEYMNIGASVAPQNAWLLLRSLRTLPIRLEKITSNASKVIEYLEQHEKVEKVLHPFSATNKQLHLAKKQMKACGGLFSIVLKNSSLDKIETFCNSLKHILMAVSWGGYESLLIPACAGMSKANFDPTNKRHILIRIYVGLEEPEYIIEDLKQALEKI
ncbi:aminotransferase class I/II-fold pyridoxal phosphate-dependent enzyme [Pedobacter sp. UBA4863]|uniref:trans-sulfuration enzyme family protein n=1 Tax=Pedobacter sp. UBA4863 TaxID=1947060 RepID=UPI0025F4DAB1|nr:aminotransferase class I/II-fold pyridoxal phosphate-dependent enzyme [Pedobacter sp. UBA4863]